MKSKYIVPPSPEKSISNLALKLHIFIPDEAFRSWLKSTRRLLKTLTCPICGRRARCKGGFLQCNHCNRGWPLDDIQELIADIETIGMIYQNPEKMPGPDEVLSEDQASSFI